jgi:hypothetical protein
MKPSHLRAKACNALDCCFDDAGQAPRVIRLRFEANPNP